MKATSFFTQYLKGERCNKPPKNSLYNVFLLQEIGKYGGIVSKGDIIISPLEVGMY